MVALFVALCGLVNPLVSRSFLRPWNPMSEPAMPAGPRDGGNVARGGARVNHRPGVHATCCGGYRHAGERHQVFVFPIWDGRSGPVAGGGSDVFPARRTYFTTTIFRVADWPAAASR